MVLHLVAEPRLDRLVDWLTCHSTVKKNQCNECEQNVCRPSGDDGREVARFSECGEDGGAKDHTSTEENGDCDTAA